MRKYLCIALSLFSLHCYCQLSHAEILIGETESEVTKYLDSLNHLKSNQYYKIVKDMSKDGDLILKSSFSLNDERYYQCSSLILLFQRIKGIEYCVKQLVLGSSKYAQNNLSFIKDNFKSTTNGNWEQPYAPESPDNPFKIVATFEKTNGEYPMYNITYELLNK